LLENSLLLPISHEVQSEYSIFFVINVQKHVWNPKYCYHIPCPISEIRNTLLKPVGYANGRDWKREY